MRTITQKKGISEIVSYVLLVIIAITISIFVFAFLKLYVPKDKPQCKEGINLIIESATCTIDTASGNNKIILKLQNRGLFNIDKAFIKIGPEGKFKEDAGTNPYTLLTDGRTDVYFLEPSSSTPNMEIKVGDKVVNGQNILEVQPAHYTKGTDIESLALCKSVTQTINC